MIRLWSGSPTALAVAILILVGTLGACSADTSKVDALAELAHEQAIPKYEVAFERAAGLEVAVGALCEEPSDGGVKAAQTEFVKLRVTMAGLEAFRHGPAMDERDQGRINTQVEGDAIEELIGALDESVFDAHYVSTSIGATKRGLYAIEYVLFVDNNTSSTSEELQSSARCLYLQSITGAVRENVEKTLIGWTEGGEIKLPYTEVLASEKNAQDNINVAVETSVFLLRKMINMELAPALALVGTEADLSGLAEGEAGLGLTVLHDRLESVKWSLVDTTGLASLLSDELVSRLNAEIRAAQAQIDALVAGYGPSLADAIVADAAEAEVLHDLIATIERTVSTEVVGELDVVVGFSDADGDSAN